MEAWLLCVKIKKGIFDTVNKPEAHTEPNFEPGEGLEDDKLEESISGVHTIIAHHVWLDFLAEFWQVCNNLLLSFLIPSLSSSFCMFVSCSNFVFCPSLVLYLSFLFCCSLSN